MMDLNITNEELNALKFYRNEKYEAINQMLVSNSETDIALLSDEVEKKAVSIEYDKESVIEYLKNIKLIYKLILKSYYKNSPKKEPKFYRGTNLAEVELIKREPFVDRFLAVTENKEEAQKKYTSSWNRPASMNITLANNIPYINIGTVLKNKKYKNEILILPFTKIKKIYEDEEKKLEKNSKILKIYNVELEKQELDGLSERERNGLYTYILENCYSIKRKLEECINLERENATNFENIRKLEQLLAKYELEDDEDEFENDLEEDKVNDIERITKELKELKNTSTNLSEVRKENINFVNMWKRNIAVYMIAECKEIEKDFKKFEVIREEVPNLEEIENNEPEESDVKIEDAEEKREEVVTESEEIIEQEQEQEQEYKEHDSLNENESEETKENTNETKVIEVVEFSMKEDKDYIDAKIGSEENIEAAEKILENIKSLINKQQNHAKIAGNLGASYSALNNAFGMRNVAENLLGLLKDINVKVLSLGEENDKENIEITKIALRKISRTNLEVSTLINYLNNPKIAARNTSITRFDEMAIIEENELKRVISEKIREIRGEAELKKLKDDLEIINSKSAFERFLGIFTGKNKLDDFMIDQIEIRQNAIRKTLSTKLSLAYNFSIHELVAEITMFVRDNDDDELVENDVADLKAIAEELKKNFVILDSKVQSIVEAKENKNLPLETKRRLSKMDMIEVETYRFLNKYGYDISRHNDEEPKYQDTVASEITRIIEYINSANIF